MTLKSAVAFITMPDSVEAILRELDKTSFTPPSEPGAFCERRRSIPHLTADKRTGADLVRFNAAIEAMADQDTTTLILRIETASDPLALWGLHQELDRRGVAPALRWPSNEENPQNEFITALADLFWLAKRNPTHQVLYRGWRGIFKHTPGGSEWHAAAHRQFVFTAERYALSHKCAQGLGLTAAQRQDLMILPTAAMVADRRALHPDKFADFRASLLAHAMQHPDKSGQRTPGAIANRRARLWRVFVLSGHSQTATAKNWHLMTGETLTRQAIAKQLAIISIASK